MMVVLMLRKSVTLPSECPRAVKLQGSTFMPCAGHPAVLRYWQESSRTTDWLKPDQTSGVTVETTAYVLLTVLIKVMSLPVPYLTQCVSGL